ncbi:hypothetical protein [Spirosoma arcticum]
MLDALQTLADTVGHTFGYGGDVDLDNIAQSHTEGYLLFHEGYFEANLNQDGQGALEYRHLLILDVCAPSLVSDSPDTKREHLLALKVEMEKVYARLTKLGQISGARAQMGLNLTSRNLDAIKLTLTLLTPAVSICKHWR